MRYQTMSLTILVILSASSFPTPCVSASIGSTGQIGSQEDLQAGTFYYVGTNGGDNDPGTEARPFRTITKGLSVLAPGDTLYIKSGTYAEALTGIPGGTSWTAPVTVAAYPGHTVVINGARWGYVVYIGGSNRHHIVLDGLILDGVHTSKSVVSINEGAHHIRIQNCEIKNAYGSGIFLAQPGSNEFISLEIHHNGTSGRGHGIYVESNNNLIEGCAIHHSAGWGVHVYNGHAGQGADGNVVRDNVVYDNTQGDYDDRGVGIGIYTGSGNIAYNNLVWGANAIGIAVNYGASNTRLYNNTVYHNNRQGIYIGSEARDTIVRNNIVYLNTGSQISDAGARTAIQHNLTANPQFRDPSAHDFHLQPTSPAVDAGVALSEVSDDFDGVSRPRGTGYDIGAYEYLLGPPISPGKGYRYYFPVVVN